MARASIGLALLVALFAASRSPSPQQESAHRTEAPRASDGCLTCHAQLETMHPEAALSCVDCHGGNGTATRAEDAHVKPQRSTPGDERIAPLDDDLAWRRFVNPMDLRVAQTTCGTCHASAVHDLGISLHGTTAGHLSDGYYEMGLVPEKRSAFGVFAVPRAPDRPGEIAELAQIPPFKEQGSRTQLATHYADLGRKECLQCHLWSQGRAVRGRVGFDGDYRGEGCAACHVPYALDGLSRSADTSVSKSEPGHPRIHAMTRAPTTQTCTSCHYGDASIGLSFRGLSQLPPGAPGGPEIPGTTDELLNRAFYIDDPALVPPDVHHERGMHCIDCHTQRDVMGDGALHGAMEQAVEISCSDCHGTFTAPATLRTQRGAPLEHLARKGEDVFLTSKVDGAVHRVPQAAQVLAHDRPEYNPDAAKAMTPEHANVECYTCHAGWNVNFLGFHFDRNESLTQLDLLTGKRTKGRVTTQEKVFATWKSFYAGLNESGRVAPYLTGFSTMGTVRDDKGDIVIDQALPVTSAGLSGLTMVHHQLHTTRPTARSCVECHRTSTTWGMGSVNFRLGRELAFVADERGIEVVALDRGQLASSTPLAKIALSDALDLELDCDPLQGHARKLFVAEEGRGIHVLDVSIPTAPRRTAFVATADPRGLALAGEHLYCADGVGGLKVFRVTQRGLDLVGSLPTCDARGVHVQWPFAYVADGPGGLAIVDVRHPEAPALAGGCAVSDVPGQRDAAIQVTLLFQYSRPMALRDQPVDERSPARNLCAVLDEDKGLRLVDVTEPTRPALLWPRSDSPPRRALHPINAKYRGFALASHVDLAEPQGGTRTREGDFAYVLAEQGSDNGERFSTLLTLDVSKPQDVRKINTTAAGKRTAGLAAAWLYNPPFLQSSMLSAGSDGVLAIDVTVSAAPKSLGALAGLHGVRAVALEEFPLDKMLDEDGRALKDVSHASSRWMHLDEIDRVLAVSGESIGTIPAGAERADPPFATARLTFAELDRDHSCFLEGEELESAGASLDTDGDARISLSELAGLATRDEATDAAAADGMGGAMDSMTAKGATDPESELSRLLDGIHPQDFDVGGDRRLERGELEKAFVVALDLDRDQALSQDELSRLPGEMRTLRVRGPKSAELFAHVDLNHDGKLAARDFHLDERTLRELDPDGDGACELGEKVPQRYEARGMVPQTSEWPARRRRSSDLPPVISAEHVLEVFDTDRDGVLSARELKRRPDLLGEFDANNDGKAAAREIQERVDFVALLGVELCADEFTARWDLDGDGKVSAAELPASAARAAERGRAK